MPRLQIPPSSSATIDYGLSLSLKLHVLAGGAVRSRIGLSLPRPRLLFSTAKVRSGIRYIGLSDPFRLGGSQPDHVPFIVDSGL